MRVIGWDPGAAGAFAFRLDGGIKTFELPSTDGNLARLVQLMVGFDEVTIFYESQTGCAGIRTSAPAMFKYGTGYGKVLGAVAMYDLARTINGFPPIIRTAITPREWQKMLQLPIREKLLRKQFDGTDRQWGNYKAGEKRGRKMDMRNYAADVFRADKLFQPITLDNCDALLLLKYGERALKISDDR